MKIGAYACVLLTVTSAGCYHAVIDTGRAPSTQTIEKPWASGWIYGLVPPSVLETAQKCPNGPAKVETQLSFANQLVYFLTFGIYTPMWIKVTCAESGTASLPPSELGSSTTPVFEDAQVLPPEHQPGKASIPIREASLRPAP
ncbi:MAG: Bor family protein [Anaerolineae bacterium]|nr:Bor family protein [Gemmatimonadaceae bacterium]